MSGRRFALRAAFFFPVAFLPGRLRAAILLATFAPTCCWTDGVACSSFFSPDPARNRESMKQVAASRGQTPDAIYKAVQRIRDLLFDCVNQSLAAGTGQ